MDAAVRLSDISDGIYLLANQRRPRQYRTLGLDVNHDRLLTQLSHVLDAPTEQRLFGVFSDIVGAAGGTAFDVVGGTTPAGGSAVRGLIGWCECHALHEASGEVAAFDGRPLFWGYARAEGVRAT